jgi:hypothetical protein
MFQKGDLVRAKGETIILQEKFYVVTRSDLNTEKHNLLVDWCEIVSLDTGTHFEMPNRFFELVKRGNNAQPA